MEKDLIKFIKDLSLRDKKPLTEKALKVGEESGELAKAVLSHAGSSGSIHKIVSKEDVLVEVADTFLASISIAFDLGFSYEDFESMVRKQTQKWQSIQNKEEKIEDGNNIPFEIHVTIDRPEDIGKYVTDCRDIIGVKPIVLDLQNGGGVVMKDVMTSSHTFGGNSDALVEVGRISKQLGELGYNVVREKIESVPWHPMAPTDDSFDKTMPNNCYFEAHIGVIISDDPKELIHLKYVADICEAHLSSNTFKKNNDGTSVIMVTLREYEGTAEDFNENLEDLKDALSSEEFIFEKVITEFAIYDTKVSHDFLWLK